MITLNLFEGTSRLLDRMRHNIVPGITDLEFLEREIARWLGSKERARQIAGEAYYDGEQDILRRKRTAIGENGEPMEIDNLPNNRIVDNQYAKMVDQKANYLCGQPVTFDTKNKTYGELLTRFFGRKLQRTIRIIAEKALTGGKVWLFPYYAKDGALDFAIYPAHEVLPFWSDAEHNRLDCAVHLFPVYVYDEQGDEKIVQKVEVIHGSGIDRFIWDESRLIYDNDAPSGAYLTVKKSNGDEVAYNWERLPLICFKYNHRELPLLCRVKCLQDALNMLISNFANGMEEDVRNTILVLHNYDGENLGEFRRNLATYGVVKVRNFEGADGGVETLTISVDSTNYKTVLDLLKRAIIENAKGYDAKDERMSGTPNQMNIRSMYSDIDLDANGMGTEFQASFEDLLWFVNTYLANSGAGSYFDEDVKVIFNRDILVNESEVIENCGKSKGIISDETLVKMHPWVNDPEQELERIRQEKEQAAEEIDAYRAAFERGARSEPENGAEDEETEE